MRKRRLRVLARAGALPARARRRAAHRSLSRARRSLGSSGRCARCARWQPGGARPDARCLKALQAEHGALPLVAEDLGFITPDVEALRRRFRLPGMRVLQFAFDGDPYNPHLPHMHRHNSVVYTGTHDNDTSVGWFASLDRETRRRVEFYLRTDARAAARGADPRHLGSVAAARGRAAAGSVGPRLRGAAQYSRDDARQLELADAAGCAHSRACPALCRPEPALWPRVSRERFVIIAA